MAETTFSCKLGTFELLRRPHTPHLPLQAWDAADAQAEAAMRQAGIAVATADAAFIAEIRAKTAGFETAWIETARAKGIDGEPTLRAFRAEIAALSRK